MNALAYIAMIFTTVAIAAVSDWAWINHIKPRLTHKPAQQDERIPAYAWVSGAAFVSAFIVVVPVIGATAGY